MKDQVTAIYTPPSPLNAVFATERGIKKKLCLLAGIQRVNDDQTTAIAIEAMIYRDDKKAWYRAKEASGFLGVEFAEHPADWSVQVRDFEEGHSAMEQEAAKIVNTIERERTQLSQPTQRELPQRQSAPPTMQYARSPLPPSTLPDGTEWREPKTLPPEERPASPQLNDKQMNARIFKW